MKASSLMAVRSHLGQWRLMLGNRRHGLDTIVRWSIIVGGLSVLSIIILLIVFLVANALPLLAPPNIEQHLSPQTLTWLNAETSWRPNHGRLPLRIQDPKRRRWAGGYWQLWITSQTLTFEYVAADALTGIKTTQDDPALEHQTKIEYTLEEPVQAACAHPAQGLVYVLNQQGQLYSWFWVGNRAYAGEWHRGEPLATFAGDVDTGIARNTAAKVPAWGIICHPASAWAVIWNQQRWWLWSVTTEQVLVTEPLPPSVSQINPLPEVRFAQSQDPSQLLWGLYNGTAMTNRSSGVSNVWSYDQNHTGLLGWKSVFHEARPLGFDQRVPMWVPDTDGQSPPAFYNIQPLLEGSFKVAMLALLLATPLSLSAAIYSSHFLSVRLRGKMKPMIELIEAVPTVVLGFIAVLVFGPWLENHLFGFLWALLLLPLVLVVSGVGWTHLPLQWRRQLPGGWEIVLVLPLLALSIGLLFTVGEWLENQTLNAGLIAYLDDHFEVNYQNRNALLTGLAMGVALIPTLYSIAEDALYTVPKSLRDSSLALGATPWQTLSRVILPMASPGIFAALMIGFGRALGETMIVLMASGNSPSTSWNLFEGLRSLSATLALEMPAANVYSTHYHMLFLLALFLFSFTFAVNSVAEWIRYRLRARYGAQG